MKRQSKELSEDILGTVQGAAALRYNQLSVHACSRIVPDKAMDVKQPHQYVRFKYYYSYTDMNLHYLRFWENFAISPYLYLFKNISVSGRNTEFLMSVWSVAVCVSGYGSCTVGLHVYCACAHVQHVCDSFDNWPPLHPTGIGEWSSCEAECDVPSLESLLE